MIKSLWADFSRAPISATLAVFLLVDWALTNAPDHADHLLILAAIVLVGRGPIR